MHLTLFPSDLPHANAWYEAGEALHVEFGRSWLEDLGRPVPQLRQPMDFRAGSPVWLARRLAWECGQHDGVQALAIEGLSMELLAAIARAKPVTRTRQPPRWLARTVSLLNDRFREPLSLQDLARGADVSADHLARTFRSHYRCTPGQYLRQLRIEHAQRELEASKVSIVTIAAAAGFSDQSHFTRWFRRHTGTTPAQYRAHHGKDRFRSRR